MNAITGHTFQMNKLFNIKQVVEFTGLSRATIYSMIDPKQKQYDPSFPKQIQLSINRVAWLAWELNQWIEDKMANREKGTCK